MCRPIHVITVLILVAFHLRRLTRHERAGEEVRRLLSGNLATPVVALERLLRRVQLLDVVGEVGAGAKVGLLAHPEHGRG